MPTFARKKNPVKVGASNRRWHPDEPPVGHAQGGAVAAELDEPMPAGVGGVRDGAVTRVSKRTE